MTDYWNHNAAYHRELVQAAARRGGSVLDVGCGDGLLLARLSEVAERAVGIDCDRAALVRADERLAGRPNSHTIVGDVMTSNALDGQIFDLVVCVAALHHLPLEPALARLRDLVAPGGQLRIIGLSATEGVVDWAVSGASVIPVRVMSRLRGEADYDGMVTVHPRESLAEIRRVARSILPGSRVRRRFYYRYALTWNKPSRSLQ